MTDELKDDTVIGTLRDDDVLPEIDRIYVLAGELHKTERRWLEIGKRACTITKDEGLDESADIMVRGVMNTPFNYSAYKGFFLRMLQAVYAAGLASADLRIAELERELEIAKALQPPPPEPEIKIGSASNIADLAASEPKAWRVEIHPYRISGKYLIGYNWLLAHNKGGSIAVSKENYSDSPDKIKQDLAPLIFALRAEVVVIGEDGKDGKQ